MSCGRKVDAFKFWLMFKKHGERGFEHMIDNAFEKAAYFADRVKCREGFELIVMPQYTNVCFHYIPKFMRQREPKDEKWKESISKITAIIKEKMMKNGNLMIGYSPLASKGLKNFFRMVVTAQPPATEAMMDFVLNQIEEIGESLEFHDQF